MFTLVLFAALSALPATAQTAAFDFGDDRSDYAHDDECDDRRFTGPGMASGLDIDDNGHDASDCRRLLELGHVTFWTRRAAEAATDCATIRYGDNSSQWARDGDCDDPRFEGPGVADIVVPVDIGRDADDCRAACEGGRALLRNY